MPRQRSKDFVQNHVITHRQNEKIILQKYVLSTFILDMPIAMERRSVILVPSCFVKTPLTIPNDPSRSTLQFDLLSVSASRGPVFRLYLLNEQIDQDGTWALGISVTDLIFHDMLL